MVLKSVSRFSDQKSIKLLLLVSVSRLLNDDIQGTAAVTLGTILAACKTKQQKLRDMKVVFVGAGSAGRGIAEMLIQQMGFEGLTD